MIYDAPQNPFLPIALPRTLSEPLNRTFFFFFFFHFQKVLLTINRTLLGGGPPGFLWDLVPHTDTYIHHWSGRLGPSRKKNFF